MRRNAGAVVRNRLLKRSLILSMLMGICTGGLVGALIDWWIVWVADLINVNMGWSNPSFFVFLPAFILTYWYPHVGGEWRLENLSKGFDAEMRVGQVIEYAITDARCAVAHSVTSIAKVGDIDHIVATPAAIWVVETKYRKVPRKAFPKVLERIADNAKSVRDWAKYLGYQDVQVHPCLILAYESKIRKNKYDKRGETIRVYLPDQVAQAIKKDLENGGNFDERLSREVWKLGTVIKS